jgi:predicted transcriptional regulator
MLPLRPLFLIQIVASFSSRLSRYKVFTNGFCERHLNLLRAVRNDGPVKPAVLAKRLDLDLSRVLSDLRDLASLGLIDETRRGVRVDYDELTVSVRVDE